jgi:hypothetical protein
MKDPRCIVGWHNDATGADLPPDSEPVSPDKILVVCSWCGRSKVISIESGPFTLRAPDDPDYRR